MNPDYLSFLKYNKTTPLEEQILIQPDEYFNAAFDLEIGEVPPEYDFSDIFGTILMSMTDDTRQNMLTPGMMNRRSTVIKE